MSFTNITKGQVLRYTLLPEVTPRLRAFVNAGFANLASFMALIYQAVHLLPNNHPYLQVGASGTFGVVDVLREASANLVFSRQHTDQIIIFFALLTGVAILGVQFILLLLAFMVNPANAQATMPTNYGEFFTTMNPDEDLALRLLDSVFGVEGIFNSKEEVGTTFHIALHQLFQFYSIGLLVIAAMVIIYYIFAILAETAQTGTPFGKRYNHVWAPIRLVAAIGLLIPMGTGLNSGQWITLYAAKFGSGFATNGWIKFNDVITDSSISADELVARPKLPDLKDVAAFMMLAKACQEAYYLLEPSLSKKERGIKPYVINGSSNEPEELTSVVYSKAVEDSSGRLIKIRFGEHDPKNYANQTQNVYPYCGEISLSVTASPFKETGSDGDTSLSSEGELNARFYTLIRKMWYGETAAYIEMNKAAKDMMHKRLTDVPSYALQDPGQDLKEKIIGVGTQEENYSDAGAAVQFINEGLDRAVEAKAKEIKTNQDFAKYGWGGAGIWYNEIAAVNGAITTAAMNKPQVTRFPDPMEYTCEENKQQNANTASDDCYNARLSKSKDIQYITPIDRAASEALYDVFEYWNKDIEKPDANIFIAVINAILGTQGLFDMCENADIHPLAQLSTLGKGLVEASIRNLGYALGTGAAGMLTPYFGPALSAASSFFVTVASTGILIGFLLFYIIPFLPFLYFLFAVGGWVKGIFEAMVGVPLWALAHIRIDGQGLPGDAAINGYFLIFEIFIRPILIIFGLLASIIIFGAMVKVLNDIFSLVVSNLSGFDSGAPDSCGSGGSSGPDTGEPKTGSIEYFRGPVDEFFFTILYAIIVYMIGMSCFKLIDLIPNNILRWMGAGVSTFNDQAGEPAEGLVSKMAIGGSILGQTLQGVGGNFVKSAQSGATAAGNMFKGDKSGG